ncbi:hypothetical protein EDC05_005330 [Coemansia umbellata]|nr:hypothetical protein EDC05_005330 [Coemansia umbellata]
MNQDGWMSRFGSAHDRLFSRVHGNTCFFPFHRRFVLEFENIARQYDPNFVVPYWDATQSYRTPASDPLLTPGALGTNGQESNKCLTNGIQANMQISYPNNHCLSRSFNQGNSIASWYAPEIISSYIQSDTSLAAFRENIEYSIHGAVHLGMGGDMNSGYAADDFSFMVHHANLDRLWWDWQNTHGSFLMYDGNGSNGAPASLSDAIPEDSSVPFGGAIVNTVMVLGYNDVCYTYDSSPSPPQTYPSSAQATNNPAPQQQQQQPQPQQQQPQQSQTPNGLFSASRPILSGSSSQPDRLLETQRLQNSLGNNIINRFFPSLASGFAPFKRRAYQEKASDSDCGQPLPFPPRLTPEWIKMHGFDADRVEMFHKNACDLVELLNNSTYVSPY